MYIEDIFSSKWVQIGLVIIAVFVIRAVGRKSMVRIIRRSVRAGLHETKLDEQKREDTIIDIFGTSFSIVLWAVAAMTILGILEVNIAGLLTGAGLIGIVVGLGAQNTIKDYLAGFFILLENQYRVGDIITLSGGTTGLGTSGVVEDISLRITKLRDLDGTLSIIRNGEASIITNRTFKYSSVVVDVTVTFESNINAVEEAMNKVGLKIAGEDDWKGLVTEPIQFLRIEKFTDSGVIVRAVGKVKPAAQWDVAGEYRRQLLTAFLKDSSIEIALPQRIIYSADKVSPVK